MLSGGGLGPMHDESRLCDDEPKYSSMFSRGGRRGPKSYNIMC